MEEAEKAAAEARFSAQVELREAHLKRQIQVCAASRISPNLQVLRCTASEMNCLGDAKCCK
jgi:hypothetical protein